MAEIQPQNNLETFIPEIYSKKLARVAKQFTKFIERNCNREWEGEIRNFGDKVRIALPDPNNVKVAITQNAKEVCPDPRGVEPTEKTLDINNVATFALKFSDIENAQSQFDILNGYGAIAMQKLGDKKDKQVMAALINNGEANRIGTPAAPQAVTKDDIYDKVVDMAATLMTAGYLNADGFYSFKGSQEQSLQLAPVVTMGPTMYEGLMNSNKLTHPTVAGDEILYKGIAGQIAGMKIFQDTNIEKVTAVGLAEGANVIIAGTKMGVTFAEQFSKVEKLRDPQTFADIGRALYLYGYKITNPKSLVVAFVEAPTA